MGQKGDLLELLDRAPAHLQTFKGQRWSWRHHARSRRAFELVTKRNGGQSSQAMLVGSGPVEETLDRHDQVWIELPNKWRVDGSGHSDLSDGICRWVGRSDRIIQMDEKVPELTETELAPFIRPGDGLLGYLKFDEPAFDEVAGRRCWKVEAHPIEGHRHMRMSQLSMRLSGVDHTFWFDTETGIVLRHVGTVEDQPCAIHEFGDMEINVTFDSGVFRFTPPTEANVERSIDGVIRHAELRGVDLSNVDRNDPAAVRRAFQESMRQGRPLSGAMKQSRRAKHVPVGSPPADPDEARRQIEHAFSHHGDVAADGTTLINVQSGENMAPLLAEAGRRLPKSNPESVTTVVDDVLFLRPDEAVVWFGIEIDGERFGLVNGREGRAVLVDGRWLMERASLVDLLTAGGVMYPPQDQK